MLRTVTLFLVLVTAAGCWNAENRILQLGDISLGQQLIDLKRALDEDALTQDEYDTARSQLLNGADLCASDDDHGIGIIISDDDDNGDHD